MSDIRWLRPHDSDYPRGLSDLSAPPVVQVRGQVPERPTVLAVVGARRASEEGRRVAYILSKAAAEAGVWVISGGAIGIDAAAHEGALAAGGPTLAVLGTPLGTPGPKANRALFEAIIAGGGGWLSEQEGPPSRRSFTRRNRLIAALADWVLVVEAQANSGTRHTLNAGYRLRRSLAAVTWGFGDARGTQAGWVFAREGAPIDAEQTLLRRLGCKRSKGSRGPESDGLDEVQTVESFAAKNGMTVQQALVRLTTLELDGRVYSDGGRYHRR